MNTENTELRELLDRLAALPDETQAAVLALLRRVLALAETPTDSPGELR